jgi:transcriptional regulator with XRE-family HTH domain
MNVATPTHGAGELLRDWRRRRRMSQLDLGLEANVSARHISFVETGRSKPSRELILHLAEQLEVPLRERNVLLLAAGYAPVYDETPLDNEAMTPARAALEKILAGHEPFPAVIVDGRWDLISANRPAMGLLTEDVAPDLLAPPVNAMRVNFHPKGLAPRISNLPEYSAHWLTRLQRQAALSPDPAVLELIDELRSYPGVSEPSPATVEPAELLFVPLRIRALGEELSFFSTIATFGTALDITLAELSIESLFPADGETDAVLRRAFG